MAKRVGWPKGRDRPRAYRFHPPGSGAKGRFGEDTNTRTTRTLASIFIAPFPRAEAIAEAVQRPTMKFVATKTAEQLDLAPYCGAADQRYECAAPHSITSSASASMVGGTVRPSAFAVFRLITSSNLVGA
jgi:hypothetical protein